jgi:hypothetical protein
MRVRAFANNCDGEPEPISRAEWDEIVREVRADPNRYEDADGNVCWFSHERGWLRWNGDYYEEVDDPREQVEHVNS